MRTSNFKVFRGRRGPKGDTGPRGPMGATGPKGDTGPAGLGAVSFSTTIKRIGISGVFQLVASSSGVDVLAECGLEVGPGLAVQTEVGNLFASGTLAYDTPPVASFEETGTPGGVFFGSVSSVHMIASHNPSVRPFSSFDIHIDNGNGSGPCNAWGLVIPGS